jgi:thiol-disulfide isomerase/thioredoxin
MENVSYLEVHDFDSDGNIKPYVCNGKSVIIMAQASYCGHCTKAIPEFEKFAKSQPNVVVATVVSDGEESEKSVNEFFKKWDKYYMGVPTYFGFTVDGKYKNTHQGGRDYISIKNYCDTL